MDQPPRVYQLLSGVVATCRRIEAFQVPHGMTIALMPLAGREAMDLFLRRADDLLAQCYDQGIIDPERKMLSGIPLCKARAAIALLSDAGPTDLGEWYRVTSRTVGVWGQEVEATAMRLVPVLSAILASGAKITRADLVYGFDWTRSVSEEDTVEIPSSSPPTAAPTEIVAAGLLPLTLDTPVLIADPNEDWPREIRITLERKGFRTIHLASNPLDVLASLAEYPDTGLIITNVKRQGDMAQDLATLLDWRKQVPRVHFIVLTGYTWEPQATLYEDTGIWVVGKPLAHKTLPALLDHLLAQTPPS